MKFNQPPNPKELKCTIGYNELGAYCLPEYAEGQPAGVTDIIKRGVVYEACTMHFVRENCGDGDIIHAGAYFGDMLPGFSQKCNGQVWAFEPSKRAYDCARITAILNGGLGNVFLTHSALGNMNGVVILRTANTDIDLAGGSRIVEQAHDGCQEETAQITTIDGTIPKERDVSIIQLDTEGHEIEGLKGGMKTIERCKPILVLEALRKEYMPELITDDPWMKENIFSMGYDVANFEGVMGDQKMPGRVHANIVLTHPDRPFTNYYGQKP